MNALPVLQSDWTITRIRFRVSVLDGQGKQLFNARLPGKRLEEEIVKAVKPWGQVQGAAN